MNLFRDVHCTKAAKGQLLCLMAPFLLNIFCSQPSWLLLFSFLGLLSVIKITISLLYWTYAFFLRPTKDLKTTYGSWALVTGSTDGIGKAIAFELAQKNLNLVLIGRNQNKLDTVSTEIQEEFKNVQIKKVVIDLSGDMHEGIKSLRKAIEGLDVGVLVNCAGSANERPLFLDKGKMEMWMAMIKVNLEALTMVTRVVLQGMIERKTGAMLNIGSGSTLALPSFPLYAVYAGSKAYVDQFSKSLYGEYKSRGIDVQCQIPMLVNTKMVPRKVRVRWHSIVATTEAYARAAVHWIGYGPQCVPYLPHFVQCCLMSVVPDFILNWFLFNWFLLPINVNKRKIK